MTNSKNGKFAAAETATRGKAENKGEQCRCRILNAARKLFYEKGFFATSISDVASEAGVLKGNLSYYFPSKSELLEGTTAARTEEIRAQLEEWSNCRTLYASLDCFIAMYVNSAGEIAQFGCDIGTLTDELGKGQGQLQERPRQIVHLLQDWLINRFLTRFPAKKAKAYAEALFSMMQGAAVLTHANREPELLQRQASITRQWLKGLCK